MVDSGGDSMDATLQTVAATLSTLKADVEEQFRQVREQFKRVDEQIRAEGDRTRRHFEVLMEHMKAERNLALDVGLANTTEHGNLRQSHAADRSLFENALADHEERLSRLEKKD
jgi:cell wall assembly regulator SMI1